MTARDGGDDLVTNFDCVCYKCLWIPLCVFVSGLCMCVIIKWRGAEGFLFQHQQADESLGPNGPKAKLALLLFLLTICLSHTNKKCASETLTSFMTN